MAVKKRVNRDKLLRQKETSSNAVIDNISAGNFSIKSDRGIFQVEVRRVPDAFSGYGLRPGDKIIGTSDADFYKAEDITSRLGGLSDRPVPLKIQRGNRPMFLNPPKIKSTPENKSTAQPGKPLTRQK